MLIKTIQSNGRKLVWVWASSFWPTKTSWSNTSWRNKVWLKCTMIGVFKMLKKARQQHAHFCKTTAALSFGARPLSSQTYTRDSAGFKRSTTFRAATKLLARTRFPSALAKCRPSTEIRTSILCRSSSLVQHKMLSYRMRWDAKKASCGLWSRKHRARAKAFQ